MALLLSEIQWSDPVLPATHDAAWETELKRRGVPVLELDRRVAPSLWLREATYEGMGYLPDTLPERLLRMGGMVTAQENACRYCYGANRALMKLLGYSESFIQKVERELQLAELDDKERAYIAFCRSLARSRPRPAPAERAALSELGYSPAQIGEMAFSISFGCFYNRVSTLLACPPERNFERMASGPLRWLLALALPLKRKLASSKRELPDPDPASLADGSFGMVLRPLTGLRAAKIMKATLDGCFEPGPLSHRGKALIFAVVARALGCPHCEAGARQLLIDDGLAEAEIESAMATLRCSQLPPGEAGLLAWARDTVSYEASSIQQKTRALGVQLGASALLEAVGVAALANGTVRLATLLD